MHAIFAFCRQHELHRVVSRMRATNERMKAILTKDGFSPVQIYYGKML
jgi:RimJ/RimL family protein N-acetyltransferase